jgi:hypothetical protein
VLKRSPCAGAALEPPLWIIPNKALSLSLSLSLSRGHRFFRVDESFRASTRAGLTRARSLNAWVYSERNAVTHLPGLLPSCRVSCEQESVVSKNQEKKEKVESRKTSVRKNTRKNTPFSVLRPQMPLNPSPKAFEVLRIAGPPKSSVTHLVGGWGLGVIQRPDRLASSRSRPQCSP